MESNEKKLIQLRTKLEFYKKLDKKIGNVLSCDLDLDNWQNTVYHKISKLESELTDLKIEMDLSDERWDEDEIFLN